MKFNFYLVAFCTAFVILTGYLPLLLLPLGICIGSIMQEFHQFMKDEKKEI